MLRQLVVLLGLIGLINAATNTCTLTGFYTDLAQTNPWTATVEVTTQIVNGNTVPATISFVVPNPAQGLYFTEIAPGSSPEVFCDFPTTPNNLFVTLGIAFVGPPANPFNIILWHFYMWPKEQVKRILPNDPGWNNCDKWVPTAGFTPPDVFLAPPICVPEMGAHWFPQKMDLFDPATLIPVWGSYNQTIHFYEVASTDGLWDYLSNTATNGKDTSTFPLPLWPQTSGWYPNTVSVELLGNNDQQVKFTAYNFAYLTSKADWK
jgi:hypothetical protein